MSKYCEIRAKLRQGRVQMFEMERIQQSQLASFGKEMHPHLSAALNQQDIPDTHTHFSTNEKAFPSLPRSECAHLRPILWGSKTPLARVVQNGAPAASLARGYKPFVQPLYSLGHCENRGSEVVASGRAKMQNPEYRLRKPNLDFGV